jgi:hypothetical protein
VTENHYYLSFGLITHNEQVSRGTEIIIYVKDENWNASSIPDDSLTIEADALSTNCGVDLNSRFDVGNNSNWSTAHSIPVCLLYELEDIIFPENQEDWDVEVLDDTTAKKGSNIYEIVWFYAVAWNCWKASKDAEYSVVKPTENLCSAWAPSEVTLWTNTNGSLYWQWTCMWSPEKTCTIWIPSAVFDYCNQGSTLTVDYSPYYGWNVLYPYGVIMGGSSHTEQMYNCTSKPCTISNSNVSEIKSLKYNGTTLEWYPVYEVKNGVTLVKGNYDSSLCSSCTPKTCATYGYSSSSAWYCVNTRSGLSDGCWGTLTCYSNGCDANSFWWYACVATSQLSTACNNAGGISDVQEMQDWYRCVSCKWASSQCQSKWCYDSDAECNAAIGHHGAGTECYTDDRDCYCSNIVNIETNVMAVANTNYSSFTEACWIRLKIWWSTYFPSNNVECINIGDAARPRFENIPRSVIENAGNIAYMTNHSQNPCTPQNGNHTIGQIQWSEAEIVTLWYCPASQ